MEKHEIDLKSFLSEGHVLTECQYDMLYMTTISIIPTERFDRAHLKIDSYIYLPDKYKLPLRIDVSAKIDVPGLYLLLGHGHTNFGTMWSDNRRIDDIVTPNFKTRLFHNQIPMNEFITISLIYDLQEMQILINGEERYYSKKEPYMKSSTFTEMNKTGFEFKIACDKRTDLYIKSVCISEYNKTARIVKSTEEVPTALPNLAIPYGEKPNYEACISLLPKEMQDEINKTDEYLRLLRPMRFRRQLEKHGNKITYIASDYGFSYALYLSNDVMYHTLQWYIITNSKPELWHRKADLMEETLNKLSISDSEFANEMFHRLSECVGCSKGCAVKSPYSFMGRTKISCHGKMIFKMCVSDFEDVRRFIATVNKLTKEICEDVAK